MLAFSKHSRCRTNNPGQPKPSAPSKKSAPSDSKKRKVAEVASGSQPKAGSAKAVSLPIKVGKLSPQEQAVQLRAAKRTESFARLTRKAHLYQSAMDRFRRSLVYHNRRFGESIHEGEMVDLIDKSEEAELDDSLKKKQKNRDRLSKRKAKSLANKVSKLAAEPEAILVQAPARELASSAVVSSTPESLDTDVEMTPAFQRDITEPRRVWTHGNQGQIGDWHAEGNPGTRPGSAQSHSSGETEAEEAGC